MIDPKKIKRNTGQTEASVYMTGNETNRSLDTSSIQNSRLNFNYEKVSEEEMKKALDELVIRFDTAPLFYTKQDFAHLVWCITHLYAFVTGVTPADLEDLYANGRIVNATTAPDNDIEGYSYLDLTGGRMVTYLSGGNKMTYLAKEGDNFFCMKDMALYVCLKDESGNKYLKQTTKLDIKQNWQKL